MKRNDQDSMQRKECEMPDIKKICRTAAGFLLTYRGSWAFIFLCWLPVFLAAWPGVFVIDNVFQLKWYLEGTIIAHHPVLHTYLLGAVLDAGRRIFGTWEAGMCIFSLLQMIFLSAVFAYTVKVMAARAGRICRLISVFFYALIPYNPVSAFTATKDTIFAGLFLLVLAGAYQVVCDPEGFFQSWKKILLYVLLVFLMCAFRNTGIYIFLFFTADVSDRVQEILEKSSGDGTGCYSGVGDIHRSSVPAFGRTEGQQRRDAERADPADGACNGECSGGIYGRTVGTDRKVYAGLRKLCRASVRSGERQL